MAASVKHDVLCSRCVLLFDERVAWEREWTNRDMIYQKHQSLNECKISAVAGCHLCALLVGSLGPRDFQRLQEYPELANITSRVCIYTYPSPNKPDRLRLRPTFCVLPHEASKMTKSRQTIQEILTWPYAELELCDEEDLPTARQTHSFTSGEEDCIELIKFWMYYCDDSLTHSSCTEAEARQASSKHRPTRLLHVHRRGEKLFMALRSTDDVPSGVTYTTLSHCWGGNVSFKLGRDSHNALCEGVNLEKLPKTFQDAARLTISLGQHYIWIDALCIFQDSKADWIHEGARMCETYSHSVVNIMAADSSNGEGGLFRCRNPLVASACHVKAIWKADEESNLICYDPNHYDNVVSPSVLLSRAWVVQERLLSRRNVIFTRDQVYWECRTHVASEAFPDQVPEDSEWWKTWVLVGIGRGLEKPKIPHQHWKDIVEKFTRCALTKSSDKLVALGGLAKDLAITSATNDKYEPLGAYLAGLWRSQLCHQLLWTTSASEQAHRAPQYRAPTWSWASINGSIDGRLDASAQKKFEILADILSASTTPEYDEFGDVTGGTLQMRSLLGEILLEKSDERASTSVHDRWRSSPAFKGRICLRALHGDLFISENVRTQEPSFHVSWDDYDEAIQPLPIYFLLLRGDNIGGGISDVNIRNLHGLLLRPTNTIRGQYRRVGTLTMWNTPATWPLLIAENALHDRLFIDRKQWRTWPGLGRVYESTVEII